MIEGVKQLVWSATQLDSGLVWSRCRLAAGVRVALSTAPLSCWGPDCSQHTEC